MSADFAGSTLDMLEGLMQSGNSSLGERNSGSSQSSHSGLSTVPEGGMGSELVPDPMSPSPPPPRSSPLSGKPKAMIRVLNVVGPNDVEDSKRSIAFLSLAM